MPNRMNLRFTAVSPQRFVVHDRDGASENTKKKLLQLVISKGNLGQTKSYLIVTVILSDTTGGLKG